MVGKYVKQKNNLKITVDSCGIYRVYAPDGAELGQCADLDEAVTFCTQNDIYRKGRASVEIPAPSQPTPPVSDEFVSQCLDELRKQLRNKELSDEDRQKMEVTFLNDLQSSTEHPNYPRIVVARWLNFYAESINSLMEAYGICTLCGAKSHNVVRYPFSRDGFEVCEACNPSFVEFLNSSQNPLVKDLRGVEKVRQRANYADEFYLLQNPHYAYKPSHSLDFLRKRSTSLKVKSLIIKNRGQFKEGEYTQMPVVSDLIYDTDILQCDACSPTASKITYVSQDGAQVKFYGATVSVLDDMDDAICSECLAVLMDSHINADWVDSLSDALMCGGQVRLAALLDWFRNNDADSFQSYMVLQGLSYLQQVYFLMYCLNDDYIIDRKADMTNFKLPKKVPFAEKAALLIPVEDVDTIITRAGVWQRVFYFDGYYRYQLMQPPCATNEVIQLESNGPVVLMMKSTIGFYIKSRVRFDALERLLLSNVFPVYHNGIDYYLIALDESDKSSSMKHIVYVTPKGTVQYGTGSIEDIEISLQAKISRAPAFLSILPGTVLCLDAEGYLIGACDGGETYYKVN